MFFCVYTFCVDIMLDSTSRNIHKIIYLCSYGIVSLKFHVALLEVRWENHI